ncbi:MAG: hypothetical protein J6D54_07830 [Olsenella sp.]|nr:hypothetical protein [Olsenella sp.]
MPEPAPGATRVDGATPDGSDPLDGQAPPDRKGGWIHRTSSYLEAHRPFAAALSLVVIAVIAAIAISLSRSASAPADDVIVTDALQGAPVPQRENGGYEADGVLIATKATVGDKRVSRDSAEVDVRMTFSNGSIEARQDVTLAYEHTEGSTWEYRGVTPSSATSFSATSGVDQNKVLAQVDSILARAERSSSDSGSTSNGATRTSGTDSEPTLVAVYRDASTRIAGEAFDREGQVDTISIHLSRVEGFASYECDLTASFKFIAASGQWELANAAVSDGAGRAGLSPIKGTWTGAFQSQKSSGAKCFGAKEAPLSLEITKVTDDGSHIEGTLACRVHYHAEPTEDVSGSEGDTDLSRVAFVGRRTSPKGDSTEGMPEFSVELPEDSSGVTSALIRFGSPEDSERVTCEVTTKHSYEATLLVIPYRRDASFTDTYLLARE